MKRAIPPTKDQQAWQDWQRELGCCVCGWPPEIHHAVGSAGRHNKTHIGQWWTIPLCHTHHRGQGGIHGDRSTLNGVPRRQIEKTMFNWALVKASDQEQPQPPASVVAAIMDYHL